MSVMDGLLSGIWNMDGLPSGAMGPSNESKGTLEYGSKMYKLQLRILQI